MLEMVVEHGAAFKIVAGVEGPGLVEVVHEGQDLIVNCHLWQGGRWVWCRKDWLEPWRVLALFGPDGWLADVPDEPDELAQAA